MLILSRKNLESLVIDGSITLTVLEVRKNRVKLGIEAPKNIEILRREIWIRREQSTGEAA